MKTSALAAALCVALAACTSPPPAPESPAGFHACTAGVGIDTSAWQTIDDEDFSFRLPPSFTEDDVQGIDSHVRQWSDGQGSFFSLDYGAYSSGLEEFATNAEASDCEVMIGGRGALTAAARGFPDDPRSQNGWIVGVTWREVRNVNDMPTHLTMHAVAPDTARAAELMAAMRTHRLPSRRLSRPARCCCNSWSMRPPRSPRPASDSRRSRRSPSCCARRRPTRRRSQSAS